MIFSSFFSKKASANMWWIIIGALIALVVLIVLIAIFVDKNQDAGAAFDDCSGKGGICAESGNCPASTFENSGFSCSDSKVCCLGLPKQCENDDDCKKGKETCEPYDNGKSYCK